MSSSLTRGLLRHLSIGADGAVEDRTAHSTMTVLGMPPELRLTGVCDVLLFALDPAGQRMPMYLAAEIAGYRPPTTKVKRSRPEQFHPDLCKYFAPFTTVDSYQYIAYPRSPDRSEDEFSIRSIRDNVLCRYLSGAFIVGGADTSYKNQGTLAAAKSWARTYVSPRRGLCALASSTLAVVVGDESALETCGLGSNGTLEIASLSGLHEAYSSYDFNEVIVVNEVKANERLDRSLVNKAAKPDGLMVEYMKCDSLKEAALNVPYLMKAYFNRSLVAVASAEIFAVLSAWELRRQLNLYGLTYSWEVNVGAGKKNSCASFMRQGCNIPQHILERIPPVALQVEGAVEVYQRTLKERKRNSGITYKTSGAKKSAERKHLAHLDSEELNLSSLEVDYRLWRASLDSITGKVPAEWQDPSSHSEYQYKPGDRIELYHYLHSGNRYMLIEQVNYCERQGMLATALPLYFSLLEVCGQNQEGVPYPIPALEGGKKSILGVGVGNHTHGVLTPYDAGMAGSRPWGGAELIYPWVGLRVQEIASTIGAGLSDQMKLLLESAKTGCLLPEDNPFHEYFRALALEDGLY